MNSIPFSKTGIIVVGSEMLMISKKSCLSEICFFVGCIAGSVVLVVGLLYILDKREMKVINLC
jgi:hypothetical protein